MTTITTINSIDALKNVQEQVFDDTIQTITNHYLSVLSLIDNDLATKNYSISSLTSREMTGYFNSAQGTCQFRGSGFTSYHPKISAIEFLGDDGFASTIKGNLSAAGGSLSQMNLAWNGDAMDVYGHFDSQVHGHVSRMHIKTNNLEITTAGSISFADDGSAKGYVSSISYSDSLSSIQLKGKISAALWTSLEGDDEQTIESRISSPQLWTGNDTFNVPDGSRLWHAYEGNDKMTGGALPDQLFGDAGNDKLWGLANNDQLDGGDGKDYLDGDAGDDQIHGGTGNDKIVGGAGNDQIWGDLGKDDISGGDGNDEFYFDTPELAGDKIRDFQTGLDQLIFNSTSFQALSAFDSHNLVIGRAALDSDDYLVFNPSNHNLMYDSDGSGAVAPLVIVTLLGIHSLSATDIAIQ